MKSIPRGSQAYAVLDGQCSDGAVHMPDVTDTSD